MAKLKQLQQLLEQQKVELQQYAASDPEAVANMKEGTRVSGRLVVVVGGG